MPKVAERRILIAASQIDFVSRLASPTRNVSFQRSDSKCFQNISVLSSYSQRYDGSVGLVHEGMVQPLMVTFN